MPRTDRFRTMPSWTIAAIVALYTVVGLMVLWAGATVPVPVPASPGTPQETRSYRVGETFRADQLGYTVHGARSSGDYLRVDVVVHNPGGPVKRLDLDWVRVEDFRQRVFVPEVFATVMGNEGRAMSQLHDGQATRLSFYFELPEKGAAWHVLVSGARADGPGYAVVDLNCF